LDREIVVPYGADDVSTLGDPTLFTFNDHRSVVTSSLTKILERQSVPGQEDSLFDTRLPAGSKAGIVLGETDTGTLVVHSIMDTSPFYGQVKIGDRLCSIDGMDCRGKSPQDIAAILQQRSGNLDSSRILTFARKLHDFTDI
jgi:C-terminal processing protease CtpA/Prc